MIDTENKSFELKVGIFIAVGILTFFIIVFSIGDVNFIKGGYNIEVIFNFANGITESAPIRLAGVNVGQVDAINIYYDEEGKKTKVRIMARIEDENIKIERNSTFFINTLGLLGEKYMEIFPGTSENGFLQDKDRVIGRDPVSTADLTEKMSEMTDSASVVMTRLKDGEGTVGKLLKEDKIYNDLEDFVEDIKRHPWKLINKPRSTDK